MTDSKPARRLRIAQIVVTPVLAWDDGEELTPGPEVQAVTIPLSGLLHLAETLPLNVAQMQEHFEGLDEDGGLQPPVATED